MIERLILTRQQLKTFLKDHESVKQFERLFNIVDALIPSVVPEIQVQAGIADSRAQEALDAINRLADAISELSVIPLQDVDNARIIAEEAKAVLPPEERHNSISTDYIDLPDIGPHVTKERRIQWNMDDGTLDVGLYNGVVLQCGQENHYYAKNDSGVTITDGTAVMFKGTVGASGKLTFDLANADGTVDPNFMMGIATQSIDDQEFGYITSYGMVRGFDTTGGTKTVPEVWADADILYLDPAFPGELTKTMPTAPNLKLPVAVVVNAAAGGAGSIYVRMKTGEAISLLHDVEASTLHDLDLLQYNTATGRWESNVASWGDIDFPIIVRTIGPNIPTLVVINGNITMPQWAVNDYNVCESQEFIHEWVEGSTVYWHIHLTTNGLDATDRYVRFTVEYGYVTPNGQWVFPAVLDSGDLLIPANTPDKTMIPFELGSFAPAIAIAGHGIARLVRIASTGAAPTNNPWVPMLQLHVQKNTTGSRTRTAK